MDMYRLSHPAYDSEHIANITNPIRMIQETWFPGVICPQCHQTWAGSRRLYLPVRDPALRKRLSGPPRPLAAWKELEALVLQEGQIPRDITLQPGDILGSPEAEILAQDVPDFMHPFPGQIVVKARVVQALERSGITGFRPLRVTVNSNRRVKEPRKELPELYELVITGVAWRKGITEDTILACRTCYRTIFPNPQSLIVDEERWDGSDLFCVDQNPNIVLATPRVYHLFADHLFSNYDCRIL